MVFRCDKCDSGDTRKGDGVLIAIRSHLVASRIITEDIIGVEQVWTRINLLGKSIYIGGTYLPPNSSDSTREHVLNTARSVCELSDSADNIIWNGDFNCTVNWLPDTENPSLLRVAEGPVDKVEFLDTISSLGLSQICNIRTQDHNQLELIFTDLDSDFVVTNATHPLKIDSHHHALIEYSIKIRDQLPIDDADLCNLDFNKTNWSGLSSAISSINWQ